jgi:6-phosphofructokinase
MARIGILTGGGDCPGLNAFLVSAVTRAEEHGHRPVLLRNGFLSLLRAAGGEDVEFPLVALDRMRLPRTGGTIIGSSRTRLKKETLDAALAGVAALDLHALIVVGGDGSLRSAHALSSEVPVVGVPKTIDNDVLATEFSLGFQTAAQTALDAVERIQDTASSHGSTFLVEVMGRRSGFLAASAAEAVAADAVVLPEQPWTVRDLRRFLRPGAVVLVGEGAWQEEIGDPESEKHLSGLVDRLLGMLSAQTETTLRGVVLGHTLRGGAPVAADRLLATSFATKAVDVAVQGRSALVACRTGRTVDVGIDEAVKGRRFLSQEEIDALQVPVVGR